MTITFSGFFNIGILPFLKTTSKHFYEVILWKMLVRTVACAIKSDYINKQALIIVGQKQNSGKSYFCRWLCPPALSSYISENITNDKDGQIALAENIIINLDEMAAISKTDQNTLKTMMSKDRVKIRRPYDSKTTTTARRVSFYGSTNDLEFLTDHTGSVRWLCFEIETIDWNYSKNINIDEIWGQAYYLLLHGFSYNLTADEIRENEDRNEKHQKYSTEYELLQRYFVPGTLTNNDDFLSLTDFDEILCEKSNHRHKINRESLRKALTQTDFIKVKGRSNRKANPFDGYYILVLPEIIEFPLTTATTSVQNELEPMPF